ncbi:MerR family transcriptional regulator [Acidovorax lacteus]|uniref:HTH merR-type domain-containing protein n=1 Tax=Acidovorax lacteus TaxID=1924988 RepID=A0ABP8L930_9BURK
MADSSRPDAHGLTTAALCAAAGVSRGTLRLYEREGLLPAPRRSANGYRHYATSEVQRLQAIRAFKELGFTLREIALLLDEREAARLGTERLMRLAADQLVHIDQRIARLHMVRGYLADVAAGDFSALDDPECRFLCEFLALQAGPAQSTGAAAAAPC